MINIRKARETDFDDIWKIFHAIVEAGETYAYSPQTTKEQAFKIWMAPYVTTYVADEDGTILGTYILKRNQPALGAHVANASYMVSPKAQGRGVGKAMGKHSLEEAKRAGYRAMQFNLVVSTNQAAIALWKDLGFSIIGTLPKAFNHKKLGFVDAHVMYRFLEAGGD